MSHLFLKNNGPNTSKKNKKHLITEQKVQHSLSPSINVDYKGLYKDSVKLPPGEDLNEWIAMNVVEIYNSLNLCYGIVSEFCTEHSCPQMTAGPRVTYFWADKSGEKPRSLPASEYVEKAVLWASEQFDDTSIFPSDPSDFGENLLPTVKKIMSRLFRVYAHIYHSHWEKVKQLGAQDHINKMFKHFIYFTIEFKLVDAKDLEPMRGLIERLDGIVLFSNVAATTLPGPASTSIPALDPTLAPAPASTHATTATVPTIYDTAPSSTSTLASHDAVVIPPDSSASAITPALIIAIAPTSDSVPAPATSTITHSTSSPSPSHHLSPARISDSNPAAPTPLIPTAPSSPTPSSLRAPSHPSSSRSLTPTRIRNSNSEPTAPPTGLKRLSANMSALVDKWNK